MPVSQEGTLGLYYGPLSPEKISPSHRSAGRLATPQSQGKAGWDWDTRVLGRHVASKSPRVDEMMTYNQQSREDHHLPMDQDRDSSREHSHHT